MKMENLTPTQIEKLRACKTQDEMLNVIKSERIELDAHDLELINGGGILDFFNDWFLDSFLKAGEQLLNKDKKKD